MPLRKRKQLSLNESGLRSVTLTLSIGLHSTISLVSLNGEFDHYPWPVCTFNDLDIFI